MNLREQKRQIRERCKKKCHDMTVFISHGEGYYGSECKICHCNVQIEPLGKVSDLPHNALIKNCKTRRKELVKEFDGKVFSLLEWLKRNAFVA